MDWTVLIIFLVATAVMMFIERVGVPVTVQLSFKGDLKRESRWLAQYGQGACSVVVSLILWRLDGRRGHNGVPVWVPVLVAVIATGLVAVVVKRLLGRVRPNRENAGRFVGPTFRHISAQESFPSSHTASAVAMSVVLAHLYPAASPIFWTLAIICASLRYLMEAHWPSDIFAGCALGYGLAWLTLYLLLP